MPQVSSTQAVAKVAAPAQVMTIKTLMSSDSVKTRFNQILGKESAGFISSVLSVSNTAALIGAEPTTILNAAVVAATLELPINPNLGFAYIVPYNNKGQKQAQFQMGYKGFIQLAQRSGQYKTINATDVREGELISNDILTGEVVIKALDKDREKKPVIGYAAYFELLNGFRKTLYMSAEEMKSHATKYSQSYRNDKYSSSLWSTQFDVMAKKTVIKLLLSKFGPLSIEMQKAQTFDQAVVINSSGIENADYVPTTDNVEYTDNTEDANAEEVEPTPAENAAAKAAAAAAAAFPSADKKQ